MRGVGTRAPATAPNSPPEGGANNGTLSSDPGMSKNVTASVTFSASPAQLQAANGTFAAFAVNDQIRVMNSALNNGDFLVTGVDGTNQAYLVVSPPPKAEGPISVTVRTN